MKIQSKEHTIIWLNSSFPDNAIAVFLLGDAREGSKSQIFLVGCKTRFQRMRFRAPMEYIQDCVHTPRELRSGK